MANESQAQKALALLCEKSFQAHAVTKQAILSQK